MNLSARGFRGFLKYLDHLCGDRRMNREGASDAVGWLREHITDDLIHGMTWVQRDRLERTIAAVLGALRVAPLFQDGWTIRPWRPKAGTPGVSKLDGYGARLYDWSAEHRCWIDHPYRLTKSDAGGKKQERFVSEPYHLDEDALRALAALAEEGWSVRVDAEWSLHYPGSTVRVVIGPKGERP
jgi:hypothetical protein